MILGCFGGLWRDTVSFGASGESCGELVVEGRKVAISGGEGMILGCFGGSRRDLVSFGVNQ